ncbi:MAG: hypothetical protein KKG33_06345 [candidate division Zixibacteria bacterium]|nr:hypothetical protein [candidate division Zixibacteria bacterium]MBU1471740.1 hypothetical protein [candidate division Zixibacteria bacterium]MBU2625162.1 hypothetical protein [candidate division Zixibacteria bacterium]
MKFEKHEIDEIARVIDADSADWQTDHYRFKVVAEQVNRMLVLEVYPDITLGKNKGSLIVVYSGGAHLQLHNCSGFVVSEELGEVTFVSESRGFISGLVVENEAACSLYSNIARDLISSDFTKLGVEVMLSGVALSLAEEIIDTDDED